MKPDGTLTVDEIMQYVNQLQVWEKEELVDKMGFGSNKDEDDDDNKIDDAWDAVQHFGETELLSEMHDDYIIEYLEDNGYTVTKED